ncbi:MAG: SDR family oxidoreductase [Ardenticatenaceae bacterium]|nr:SDR family oxidoreductase [Ardenticatenaceae bacterium]
MTLPKNFLHHHVCVVTGGTQGIGWALVQALADHGGIVYGCGRSQHSLDRAHQELAALPWADRVHLAQCDVTNRAQLEAWLDAIIAEHGHIDVLINNAAFVRWVDVEAMSVAEAELTMRVGYDGMVYAIKKVLPLMRTQGSGHIVNMGSIAGRIFVGGASAAYAAVKAAIDAYTQILQVELQSTAVRATLVRLGTVAGTDFFKEHVATTRMPPLTRLMPALTPPLVATAVLQAIYRQTDIITLPRYLHPLTLLYMLAPRFSRWLAQRGSQGQPDYGTANWKYSQRNRN